MSTGTPTYWPSDPNKISDLLDFFITNDISPAYTDVSPNYDLSSDHTPRLHNKKTDRELYRNVINNKINLDVNLKDPDELEK